MHTYKKIIALSLLFALVLGMSGCGVGGNDKYSVVKTLAQQQFCVAFRPDDKAGPAVIAAMQELQAEGKVTELSQKWFGRDISMLEGKKDAIGALSEKPQRRTLLIGCDGGRLPFSGEENGEFTGFDVEFAEAVCEKLGWTAKFIAIDVSQAAVELGSGNVDCVWGGYAYDKGQKDVTVSPVYMKSAIVLAARKGMKIYGIGSLKGKTLTLSDNAYHNAMLVQYKKLKTRPAYIVRVQNGTADCFEALNAGKCDAIVTDRLALSYYYNK